jgi:diacylglycerol kinase family enzyme
VFLEPRLKRKLIKCGFGKQYDLDNEGIFVKDTEELEIKIIGKSSPEKIVVVGGDGTMNLVVNTLLKVSQKISLDEISLLLVPFGSGNDLNRLLNEKKNRENKSADIIPLSITVDGKKKFALNSCSIGYCAHVANARNKMVENYPMIGGLSYILSILFSLHHLAIKQEYIIDSKKIHTQLMVFMNGGFFGHGIRVTKSPMIESSSFKQISLVKSYGALSLVWALIKSLVGSIEGIRETKSEKKQKLSISVSNPTILELDGEVVIVDKDIIVEKLNTPIQVEILKGR